MGTAAALSVKISASTTEFDQQLKGAERQATTFGTNVASAMDKPSGAIGALGANFTKALGAVSGSLASVGLAVGGFSLGTVIKEFVDSASKLSDLSARTAIGVGELQRLKYAGDLVGVSLETISTAATQLQHRLAGGDSGAVGAIHQLGLNVDDLLKMDPGRAFEAISAALGKIPEPAMQTHLAMELMGRGGAAMLPLLRSNMEQLGDEAERWGGVMSDKVVKAGDDLGDTWTKLWNIGKNIVALPLAEAIDTWGSAIQFLKLDVAVSKLRDLGAEVSGIIHAIGGDVGTAPEIGSPFKRPERLTGTSADDAQRLFDVEDKKRQQKEDAAARAAAAAQKAWQKELDKLSGREAINAAEDLGKQIAEVGGLTKISTKSQAEYNEKLFEAIDAYKRLGLAIPLDKMRDWFATMKTPEVTTGLKGLDFGPATADPFGKSWLPDIPVTSGLPDNLPGATTVMPMALAMVNPFREAFGELGHQLPDLIFGTLLHGGSLIGALAGGLATEFNKVFQKSINVEGLFSGGKGSAALGLAGMGIGAAIGGYQLGAKFGQVGGAALGAGSGALAGAAFGSVVPGIGTAIGAGVGALVGGIAGLFGGRSKKKKEQQMLAEERDKWIASYGGIEKLNAKAAELGVNLGNAFTTKNPKEFQAAVESLNKALEDQKNRLEAIGQIVEGVNKRAAAGHVNTQGDLDVVGAGAVAAFALQVQEGASAIEAFNAITPAITAMRDAMASGNFTLTESAQRLLDLGGILDANKIQFENLGASGQILSAMLQGNIRDGALFAAVATDIGTQIQTVIDRGVPMGQVFALAQPQLQALWEAQQKWGFEVDATTQHLLDEAQAQGFVGEAMKSVNQQILDVLIAIGDVLGAKIPEALRGLPATAQAAADGMNKAFQGVMPPDFGVDGNFGPPPEVGAYEVPQMASGGIVRARRGGTLVNVAEAGRDEAIVPLGGGAGGKGGTVQVILDGRLIAELAVPHIPGEVRRLGLA